MQKQIHWEDEDPATPALVDPMLDDMGGIDPRIRPIAHRWACSWIKEHNDSCEPCLTMAELNTDLGFYIRGYEQALRDITLSDWREGQFYRCLN